MPSGMVQPNELEQDFVDPAHTQTRWRVPGASKPLRVVGRRRRDLIFIESKEVLAFEAASRLTFVHCTSGRFDLDLSLKELEALLEPNLLRTHRNWLVHSVHVREMRRCSEGCVLLVAGGGSTGIEVPVATAYLRTVREALLVGTVGLRTRSQRPGAHWDPASVSPLCDDVVQAVAATA
jgi:two-component system, LytTR family, response regulator LytT